VTSPAVVPEQELVAHVKAALLESYFLVAPHAWGPGVHVAGLSAEATHADGELQATALFDPQLVEDVRSALSDVVLQVPAPKPAAHVCGGR
jgi:hypothetical protein